MKPKAVEYSFCEPAWNGPVVPGFPFKWHIRRLTQSGKKLGGGIDTKPLCDRFSSGWDLRVQFGEHWLRESCVCRECRTKWLAEKGESK